MEEKEKNLDPHSKLARIIREMNNMIQEAEDIYFDNNDYEIEYLYNKIESYKNVINKYQNMPVKSINGSILLQAKNELNKLKSLYTDITYKVEKNKYKKVKERNKDTREKKIEELKNTYGLDDFEVEEVLKGNADPFEFEEDDMDEGDYYYDDDNK